MRKLIRTQFGIADLLILIGAVAAWTAFFVSQHRLEQLTTRVRLMQKASGELVVLDPTRYHAVVQQLVRYPDQAWQVFLPAGKPYRLQAAVQGINAQNFPTVEADQTVFLSAGAHRIELRHLREPGRMRFLILVDDALKLDLPETGAGHEQTGFWASGIDGTQQPQRTDQPLVLLRRRKHVRQADGSSQTPPPEQSANGLMIWINSVENAEAAAEARSKSVSTQ